MLRLALLCGETFDALNAARLQIWRAVGDSLKCEAMKLPRISNLIFAAFLGISLFCAPAHARKPSASLYQVSTLQALSLGVFDGPTTFADLLKHGNFGLGTLNALDGEVIILDGKAWQARFDGQVVKMPREAQTPFAVVTQFKCERKTRLARAEYSDLQANITRDFMATPNVIYAIKIHGLFSHLKVRSVPRQNLPYGTLGDAVKKQATWEWKNIIGTLVGFRFPSFLASVNLADYHFHFISDDKKRGGHVLDVRLESADVEIQSLRSFEMVLPASVEFDTADLAQDQKATLNKAEKG